jgi:hypothetical protein
LEVGNAERFYTGYVMVSPDVTVNPGLDPERVIFMLAWGDHPNEDSIIDGQGFLTASAVSVPPTVKHVYLFNQTSSSPLTLERVDSTDGYLLARPSAEKKSKDDYFLFYKNQTVFCVSNKKASESNVTKVIEKLGQCCNPRGTCT